MSVTRSILDDATNRLKCRGAEPFIAHCIASIGHFHQLKHKNFVRENGLLPLLILPLSLSNYLFNEILIEGTEWACRIRFGIGESLIISNRVSVMQKIKNKQIKIKTSARL